MLLHTTKAMLDEFQVLARFNVPSQIAKHFLLRVQSLYRGPWREHAVCGKSWVNILTNLAAACFRQSFP